jgi:acyl-CoA thioesterase-1
MTKKVIATLILAGVASGLGGCKNKRARTPPADLAAEAAKPDPKPLEMTEGNQVAGPLGPDRRPVIVCFGDSLTAGYGADAGSSYPDFLQQDLDQEGFQYHVLNEGVSGNTTKDGVDRMANVMDEKPQIVVLEFGGNDGLRGFKTQTTHDNLATMITTLKNSGVKVVLAGMTLPPDYGPDYVKTFTSNYPQLAKRYDVPLLPFLLQNVYGVPGMMQADRTHATAEGNKIVAENVLGVVRPLLSKTGAPSNDRGHYKAPQPQQPE